MRTSGTQETASSSSGGGSLTPRGREHTFHVQPDGRGGYWTDCVPNEDEHAAAIGAITHVAGAHDIVDSHFRFHVIRIVYKGRLEEGLEERLPAGIPHFVIDDILAADPTAVPEIVGHVDADGTQTALRGPQGVQVHGVYPLGAIPSNLREAIPNYAYSPARYQRVLALEHVCCDRYQRRGCVCK